MAAFDLTTTPLTLTLKPGQAGSVVVVVSNRLGKPFIARVDAVVTPETAKGWVVVPVPNQRQFEADPAATHNFAFTLNVPAQAVPQAIQFRAKVVDPSLTDEALALGDTVAVNVVAADVVIKKDDKVKIPWWVWPIAAVVLLGIGFGIFMLVRPKGVPNVVDKTEEAATSRLTAAGFDSVRVRDTLSDSAEVNRVLRQEPEAKADLPEKDSIAVATIVVNREATTVPEVVGDPLAIAVPRIRDSGLVVDPFVTYCSTDLAQNDRVARITPDGGVRVPRGSEVRLAGYEYKASCPSIIITTYQKAAVAGILRQKTAARPQN